VLHCDLVDIMASLLYSSAHETVIVVHAGKLFLPYKPPELCPPCVLLIILISEGSCLNFGFNFEETLYSRRQADSNPTKAMTGAVCVDAPFGLLPSGFFDEGKVVF